MPFRMKSSELSRSSSQGQTGPCPFRHAQSPPKAVVAKKAASCNFPGAERERETVRCRSKIFEITAMKDEPRTLPKQIDESFGGFLKHCALCRKKLAENKDKYMYGFLGAYCSPRCREHMIIIDGFDKLCPSRANKNQKRIPCNKLSKEPCNLEDDEDSEFSGS